MLADAPIHKGREQLKLTFSLDKLLERLGPDVRFWWDQGINKAPGSGSPIDWRSFSPDGRWMTSVQYLEGDPHPDESGAPSRGIDADVGQLPAELLGQLDSHRLLPLDPVGLLQGGDIEPAHRVAAGGDNGTAGVDQAVDAARARATVGEISDALEKVYGRHRAVTQSVTGVYGAVYEDDDDFASLRQRAVEFEKATGRRPRMLICKLGQDGHDRGAKVIATAFADIGFDVDIGPLFQTPDEAVREAIENDVHVIGISSQAAGHKTLVPQVIAGLKKAGADDIIVICGGVIPPQDHEALLGGGVSAVFAPGTNILEAAEEVLGIIEKRRATR